MGVVFCGDPAGNGLCAGLFHFIDLIAIAVVILVLAIWAIGFSK
jgi:hypothetical protein